MKRAYAARGVQEIISHEMLLYVKLKFVYLDDIIVESGNKNIVVRQLDLVSLKSVRKFLTDVLKSEKLLDILINNAGCALMEIKRMINLTEDGLEHQMPANHFEHFD